MIQFPCEHCGQKLRVPETGAGKAGRCPQCKSRIAIPAAPAEELALVRDPVGTTTDENPGLVANRHSGRVSSAHLAHEAEMRRRDRELLDSLAGPPAAPEPTGERKIFWLLDILLYPFSLAGIVILAIIIAYPLLQVLLSRLLFFLPFHRLLIHGVLGLYTSWYLAECVYDSAKGGTRAPDVFDANTGLSDLWSRVSYLLAVYILYVAPVMIYGVFVSRQDAIFWSLAAWAILFFPMGLLAMVINDSVSALNPLFLLGSILRVFLPYMGLLACMAAMAVALLLVPRVTAAHVPPAALGLAGLVVVAYSSFLFAHVLGRFYWRYRDRLDWGI